MQHEATVEVCEGGEELFAVPNDANGTTSLSIVIPVYDGGSTFDRVLSHARGALRRGDELIVVLDGSHADDELACARVGVDPIRISHSRGPAYARNLGASAASGDVILFVDADVLISADTVARVVTILDENPAVSAVIGSYDDSPAHAGVVSQFRNLLHHHTHQRSQSDAATFWGACGAIRRDVFISMGGFDPAFDVPCVEDIELGYRLVSRGYQIRLAKDIQVKHLKQWTISSMIHTDITRRAVPWGELMLRYRTFRQDLNLRPENRLSVIAAYALVASLFAAVASVWWLVVSLASALSLLLLNRSFFRLLLRKGGVRFVALAFPLQLVFYLYGAMGFVIGAMRYLWNSSVGSGTPLPIEPLATDAYRARYD